MMSGNKYRRATALRMRSRGCTYKCSSQEGSRSTHCANKDDVKERKSVHVQLKDNVISQKYAVLYYDTFYDI